MGTIDTSHMILAAHLADSGLDDADLIAGLAQEALEFMSTREWIRKVNALRFDGGFKHLGVFLSDFEPGEPDVPREVWVIVGDAPPAFVHADDAASGREALDVYCEGLEGWVAAVQAGRGTGDEMPVLLRSTYEPAAETTEMVVLISSRIRLLRDTVIPRYESELLAQS